MPPSCAATATASGRPWRVIEAAAATANGRVGFAAGRYAESRIDPDGSDVAAIDAFDLLADCDLAKIDIEGGEWPLLADERLAGLECAVILEWHPYDCPSPDPQAAAAAALESGGLRRLGRRRRPARRRHALGLARLDEPERG